MFDRPRRPILAGSLACAISWHGQALALPNSTMALADMSLEELSNIEVTSASKRGEPLSDAATSLFVITADDIRRAGATTLPEALRLAPNLHVAQISSNDYSVSARGFGGTSSNKLLVLIDGRSVYTPLYAGVFWDVQDLMLQDVERIEVISGPGGTLWGVNAVNGVINVITRSSRDTQGGLATGYASNRGNEASVRYGGRIAPAGNGSDDDAGTYRIYARHYNLHHTETADSIDVDDAGQMSSAGFRADWHHTADQIMVEGQVYRGDHGQPLPGTIVLTTASFPLSNIDVKGGHLLSRWARKVGDGDELSVQAYFDHTERVVPPTFSEKLDISDVQFQYAQQPSERHAWTLGGEYRLGQDRVTNSVYISFLPAHVDQTWISLFAQDDIALRKDLRLTLGARLERNDYTGVEWLPNARLSWKVAPEHLLWTALSRTVRAPSRLDADVYVPFNQPGVPFYILAGGPGIDAEVARVLEFGYRGQPTTKTSLSVTLYRALYDNLHTQEETHPGIPAEDNLIFTGRMRGAITGLEAWGSYQPLPTWRLSAGFAGLYQRFALAPDSTDIANLTMVRGQDPAQTWQLRSSWDAPHGLEFDTTLRHVSRLRDPDVPSYLALDLRWGWHARRDLELSLIGRNVLGAGHGEYTDRGTRSQIGPGLFVQASVSF